MLILWTTLFQQKDNLNEIDKFLEWHKLMKLIQEIENPNTPSPSTDRICFQRKAQPKFPSESH